MRRFLSLIGFVVAAVAAGSAGAAQDANASKLELLAGNQPCSRCEGTFLPGRIAPHPETKWGIISDLPESFRSYGVLYSTRQQLPANGGKADLLVQRSSDGFETINAGFDVFLFHLLKESTGTARIVVYARNRGTQPAIIRPRQVIKSEGTIGRAHDFEGVLGARVLKNDFDQPINRVEIQPGKGAVVAYGKKFGNVQTGEDSSRNVNCFGYVRCLLESAAAADLEVSVVAIPAVDRPRIEVETPKWLDRGAIATDEVALDSEPQGCALKRAVGVYPNFVWTNADEPVVFDAAMLRAEGTTFSMALPKIQTAGCEQARQTQNLVLRPGYTRDDTIGNYMIEYRLKFLFTNSGTTPEKVNVTFGKTGADVGLAFAASAGRDGETSAPDRAKTRWAWAGPKQASLEKSFLEGPLEVHPGERSVVCIDFLICGNSSLPFTLSVRKAGISK